MSILASNIQAQPESLARTFRHQFQDGAVAIEEAARLLRSAKKIVIAAMGASLFASYPLQYFLSSLGLNVISVEAGELLHYLGNTWKDAVVVLVSRSGESVEIAKLLEQMKASVPIIGVTNELQSRLSRAADVSLHMSSLPDQIVAIQTYTSTVLTLHLLGSAVAGSFQSSIEEVDRLLPAFSSFTQKCTSDIEAWDRFLTPHSNLYLLARGTSLASAHEGALLFHEVAKSPAVAMPIASFRHGPVEVVDSNFRGLVFVPHDSTRELNLALARDLLRFGGEVRLIGPSVDALQQTRAYEIPIASPSLAPLFEIVPLQVAALRLAILRGIEPGSFRFAPQVAVDEANFNQGEVSR